MLYKGKLDKKTSRSVFLSGIVDTRRRCQVSMTYRQLVLKGRIMCSKNSNRIGAFVAIAVGVAVTVPQLLPLAWPLTAISATLALAHLSMLRRRPMPWQSGGDAIRRFRRGPQPLASPPS